MDSPSQIGLPTRKALRQILLPFEQKSNFLALGILLSDVALFVLANSVILLAPAQVAWLGSLIVCLAMTRLFIVGHDCCHGSFMSSGKANRIMGRIAFLPTLTPFRWWEIGHNMAHHTYTNLVGKDRVWTPLSIEDYELLTPAKRMIYRIERRYVGSGLHYLRLWWTNLYFPRGGSYANVSRRFIGDSVLVTAFLITWITVLAFLSLKFHQAVSITIVFGLVVPFVLWNSVMEQILYLHHTQPEVRWYSNREEWARSEPFLTATVHVKFPTWIASLLHYILEHPAHHLNMNIPLYQLRAAQDELEAQWPAFVVSQAFSWKRYRSGIRNCMLYDFRHAVWTAMPSE